MSENHDPTLRDVLEDELQQGANARELLDTLRAELRLGDVEAWKRRRAVLSTASEFGKDRIEDWVNSDDEAASLLAFILDQLS